MLRLWDCFLQPLSHGTTSEEFFGELLKCIASTAAGLLCKMFTTTYNLRLFQKAECFGNLRNPKLLKL